MQLNEARRVGRRVATREGERGLLLLTWQASSSPDLSMRASWYSEVAVQEVGAGRVRDLKGIEVVGRARVPTSEMYLGPGMEK